MRSMMACCKRRGSTGKSASSDRACCALSGMYAGVAGALYVFALYRTWAADDRRIWIIAVPATITILLVLTDFVMGARPSPVPLILNIALLVLIPLRGRAAAQLQALKRPADATPAAVAGDGEAES